MVIYIPETNVKILNNLCYSPTSTTLFLENFVSSYDQQTWYKHSTNYIKFMYCNPNPPNLSLKCCFLERRWNTWTV